MPLPTPWDEIGLASLWEVGILLSVYRFVRMPLNPIVSWIYRIHVGNASLAGDYELHPVRPVECEHNLDAGDGARYRYDLARQIYSHVEPPDRAGHSSAMLWGAASGLRR
ncbi:hypothetical protein CBW46_012700 [Paenibacillus xerothermodurans]|uniref:Uncharacterized protein n=1 Tax=Paenibacillus xerothermodurans TaxID=1977292 RepID=A0A2W1NAB8_PAEXE|nr:hypothetical protein CBW46_012700 [Paenibacillus xerothermodurans]